MALIFSGKTSGGYTLTQPIQPQVKQTLKGKDEEDGSDRCAGIVDSDADRLGDQHYTHSDGHGDEQETTADAVNGAPRDEGGEDVPQLQQAAHEKGHLCTTKCFQIGGSF